MSEYMFWFNGGGEIDGDSEYWITFDGQGYYWICSSDYLNDDDSPYVECPGPALPPLHGPAEPLEDWF